jgi:hypothetical protein
LFIFYNVMPGSLPVGEYTLSMAIKATFSGQVDISFTDYGSNTNPILFDSLHFAGGSQWQRVATTFYYDGYSFDGTAGRGITMAVYDIPINGYIWCGMFALQRGRDVQPWTYGGNPTAQDLVLSNYWANAIPSTGTYVLGDIVWNTAPSNGQPIGWVCIAGGSPGTWATISTIGSGAFTAGGDLTGTYNAQYITSISGANGGGGTVTLNVNNVQFSATQNTPTITQLTPTSDVATNNLIIQSQAPYASATANKNPGNIVLNIPAPVAGGAGPGTNGQVIIQNGGVNQMAFSQNGSGLTTFIDISGIGINITSTGPTYVNGSSTNLQVGGITYLSVSSGTPLLLANQITATTATAGSATLPSNPVGYLEVSINGTNYKIPYYGV